MRSFFGVPCFKIWQTNMEFKLNPGFIHLYFPGPIFRASYVTGRSFPEGSSSFEAAPELDTLTLPPLTHDWSTMYPPPKKRALLNLDFWGGYVRGGWLTSHDDESPLKDPLEKPRCETSYLSSQAICFFFCQEPAVFHGIFEK